MSSSMEIERTKRGPNLEKRCWCSPNWNTVWCLGHISSSRCPNDLKCLHKLGEI